MQQSDLWPQLLLTLQLFASVETFWKQNKIFKHRERLETLSSALILNKVFNSVFGVICTSAKFYRILIVNIKCVWGNTLIMVFNLQCPPSAAVSHSALLHLLQVMLAAVLKTTLHTLWISSHLKTSSERGEDPERYIHVLFMLLSHLQNVVHFSTELWEK